jgi:hypothetical protein
MTQSTIHKRILSHQFSTIYSKILQSPNISFLRRFFGSSVNPAAMSAAKTKAQGIIDNNAVGTLQPFRTSR